MKIIKKTIWFLLIIILVILFLLFIKLPVFFTIKQPELPLDLNNYIVKKEQAVADLVPGAEKKINWHYRDQRKTEYALVYLHGYTGCRQDLFPLLDIVANNIGANVFYTRFKEHGLNNGETLHLASASDWLNDGVEALRIGQRLGDKVILVGFSTGASVAAWLVDNYQKDIELLVLISPNFGPVDKSAYLLRTPLRKIMLNLLIGKYRTIESEYPLYKKYWIFHYRSFSLIDMMDLVVLAQKVKWQEIKIPTLVIYTENDDLIDLVKVKNIFQQIKTVNKKIVNISEAKSHILAGSIISPLQTGFVAEKITNFIKEQ